MLRRSPDIVEVYAEHHDDILLKMQSGRLCAVQVKTKQQGGNPFKSGDEVIKVALSKFVTHEKKYPGVFERYTIATNHHFDRHNRR